MWIYATSFFTGRKCCSRICKTSWYWQKKTALRMVLHLLKQKLQAVEAFTGSIDKMRQQIKFCKRCHNISDGDICSICANSMRNQCIICVVENIRDVIAIESTGAIQRHLPCIGVLFHHWMGWARIS